MNYPQDIEAGANRNPTHPNSPWHVDPIYEIAQDIMSGHNDMSVLDCLVEAVKNPAFANKCEEGLQDLCLGPACGGELHKVIDEAVTLAATKIYEGL